MNGELTVGQALVLRHPVFIDLRSPGEYNKGTIPGAINIPLFDDKEREIIGIAYKHDQERAWLKGESFALSKLPQLLAAVRKCGREGIPVLFCWRGGQRSQELYKLLESLDIQAYRLLGGYKAYRRLILDRLGATSINKPVYVLNGLTGVGKTAVLWLLQDKGLPVIDLEGLAGHRGSLFGHLGIKKQCAQKDFDALLLKRLDELEGSSYLLVEGEGKRIGPIYVPDFLLKAIQGGQHILLTAPLEVRVQRILDTYTPGCEEERQQVEKAIGALEKYVGKKTADLFRQLLREGRYPELVNGLCRRYYDRLYDDANPEKTSFRFSVDSSDPLQAARSIRQYVEKRGD